MADQNNTSDNPAASTDEPADFVLPRSKTKLTPAASNNQAADLIRDKLAKLYASEPDPLEEERTAEAEPKRSKHQQFMYDLNHSDKDLATIQTEWHNYYLGLPDHEKHAVWQEFYESNQTTQQAKPELPAATPTETDKRAHNRTELAGHTKTAKKAHQDDRDAKAVQRDIRKKVIKKPKSKAKQHVHSLLFGLSMGALALLVFLFSFFNEMIIAPFVQPARKAVATPIIVDDSTVAPSSTPQVIIPKINVQIPLQFNATSNDEAVIEKDLESGVVHYPTTSQPGQNGNSAYFGHSSNNIFNKGKYKFAFVLLHELVPGDTFYITKDNKVYAYKVFSKTIVSPSHVEVLNPVANHTATATLITCDPPGTSLNRLVVVGDQISPSVASNAAAPSGNVASAASATTTLTSNGPTLWGHLMNTIGGKIAVATISVIAILLVFRWMNRQPTTTTA